MRFTINASWLPMAALLSVTAIPAQAEFIPLEAASEHKAFCLHIIDSDSKTPYVVGAGDQTQSAYQTYPCEYYKPDEKSRCTLPVGGIRRTKPMIKESCTTQIIKLPVDGLNSQRGKPVRQKPAMNHYQLKK